jgi:hypothetical protein
VNIQGGITMTIEPKFLTIELDTIESVPKVFYKGEEITSMLKRVDFNWITKGEEVAFFESPHLNIEHMEKDKDGKYHLKRMGWNERQELKPPDNIINWFINEIANHNAEMKEMNKRFEKFSTESEQRKEEMRERFNKRKMRNNKVFQDISKKRND